MHTARSETFFLMLQKLMTRASIFAWSKMHYNYCGLIQPVSLATFESLDGVGIDSISFYQHKSADHNNKWIVI